MNREALRNQAASRRNPVEEATTLPRKVKWTCDYCTHDFVSERVFMNHRCRERERLDELKSPTGQAAYIYYAEWMKLNRRSVPPIETFAASSFYSTFIKFAQHVHRVNLPAPLTFIRAMVENGKVQPSLWCRDNVYALYLNGYDNIVHPTTQFLTSLDLITELAKEHEVALPNIFDALGVDKILDLVKRRKISPWFLVASTAFRTYMKMCNETDANRLEASIQVGAMVMRIQQNKKSTDLFVDFSNATKELGL